MDLCEEVLVDVSIECGSDVERVPIRTLRQLPIFEENPDLLMTPIRLDCDIDSLYEFLGWLEDKNGFEFSGQDIVGFGAVCEGLLWEADVKCGQECFYIAIKDLRRFRLFQEHPDLLLAPYLVKSTGNVDVFQMFLEMVRGKISIFQGKIYLVSAICVNSFASLRISSVEKQFFRLMLKMSVG